MRAVRFHEFGDLDVLRLENVAAPSFGPDEVLIRVKYTGLNHVDLLTREGKLPNRVSLPHISGTEVAGEVAGTGSNVTDIKSGDKVLINPHLSCGVCEFCREGHDNICLRGGVFGIMTEGGYAEYTVAPAQNVTLLPESLGYREAAAIGVAGATALHMLVDRGNLKVGETVLIVAAGSGIGSFAIQLAKYLGARVIATAGSPEKLEMAKQLGADETVSHGEKGWHSKVRELTQKKGADLVFEHVGLATWDDSVASMARNGRLVTCGGHSGFEVKINLWTLFTKQLSLIGSFSATDANYYEVVRLAGRGVIKPVIHRTYPLEAAREAQRDLTDRKIFGKILLEV